MALDLTFKDLIEKIKGDFVKGEWVTVYSSVHNDEEWLTFFCGLIKETGAKKVLKDQGWDVRIGDGSPYISCRYKDGEQICEYGRWSDGDKEPLVLSRNFHGCREGYKEISEEFRLYFNLYPEGDKLKFINDNGDDEDAVLISENEIKIRLKLIKEFISLKKMKLAIYFDGNRFSESTIEELGIKEYHDHLTGDDYTFSTGIRNWPMSGEKKSQGWIMGKKLISGFKDYRPRLFDRSGEAYEEFLIGCDKDGKEIHFTCDEEKLANYFGKNQGSPHYLTPVYFKKEVLGKYYSHPEKYEVVDGHVKCGGYWSLRMDNDHPKHVMVFLGDLGHLTNKEQKYWKSFNVPEGSGISHTAWKRGFEAEFTDPSMPDLYFKQKYESFQEKWQKKFGWHLFRPLSKEDRHYMQSLRVPLNNSQQEFDSQVLSIVKITIDSLNEKELVKGLPKAEKDLKGIDKLQRFLIANGKPYPKLIEFLRNLQDLRSSGVAHLKGKNYEKLKKAFGVGDKDLQEVFEDILVKSVWTLNSLDNHFLK